MTIRLSEVSKGFKGRVTLVQATPEEESEKSIERLRELGVFVGSEISVEHEALFKDPMVIRVRGTKVALRRIDANCVSVEEL